MISTRRARSDVLVLCYHAVSDSWPATVAIPAQRMKRQLEYVLRRGYRGSTFSQAVQGPPYERTLVVTFDDAYRSTLTRGKPVLDELGLPATVFVPTAFPASTAPMAWPGIDQWLGGPHQSELEPLSWKELAALSGEGWEIGSHTVTHPYLTQLDDEALASQLVDSRAACERAIGSSCYSLAYPYGDVDDRVLSATSSAGYLAAAALRTQTQPPGPLNWPRVGAHSFDNPARFAVKVSRDVRRLRTAFARR